MNGASVEEEIVFIFGRTLQLLNFQMDPMDGSDSSLMENWQQCTQVEALKMATTVPARQELQMLCQVKVRKSTINIFFQLLQAFVLIFK